MATITDRQRDYITDLRADRLATLDTDAATKFLTRHFWTDFQDVLISRELARKEFDSEEARGAAYQDEKRRRRNLADAEEEALFEQEEKEFDGLVARYVTETAAEIHWAITSDLDAMTRGEASKAIDILLRPIGPFATNAKQLGDIAAKPFLAWVHKN